MNEIEIIPTVVPNSLADVAALLERNRAFSKVFHIDVANGTLAPNTTWTPMPSEKLPEANAFFYETHLMVKHPEALGGAFVVSGARRVIAHAEAFDSAEEGERAFSAWRGQGAKEIGIAALIDTPLEALDQFIFSCESVTLMTIDRVGTQGIPFDDRAFGRIADLHARYPDLIIEVDGGIGDAQIASLAREGARRFSVGSALAKSSDPAKTHKELLRLAQGAL